MQPITYFFLALLLGLQAPQVEIVAPADPAIIVQRIGGGSFSQRALELIPYSVVLTTTKDILGLAVQWLPEGGKSWTTQSEIFGATTKTPIVSADKNIILTPGGFYRSDILQVGARPDTTRTQDFDRAALVTINIDAVIFDDGVVIGPDKSGLVDSINARPEAIARISQAVRSAASQGSDAITAALRALLPPPSPFEMDKVTQWTQVYVGQLLNFPERRDQILTQMESLPKPPTFIRK